jgi:signal transduction histidine kinase
MFRVLGCITEQHDLRLVVLAGIICLFASFTAINLTSRVRLLTGWPHAAWLAVAAFVAGTGVWATHFIAMLAFQAGFPVGYDIGLTALSVVIAILLSGCGLFIAAWFGHKIVGGAILGLAVGAMHFTGMAALISPAAKEWDMPFVYVSLAFGVAGGALSMVVGLGSDTLKARLSGASLLALGICGLHFTAMAALALHPDPTFLILFEMPPDHSLVVSVVAATLLIVTFGFAGSIVDQHLAERTAREAERLRAHVAELEATKQALEVRTEQVKVALTEAAAGSQAKSQFLAAMSHELRTPLNAIIGFSEVQATQMFGPMIGDARYLEYAKDIHRSGSHLLSLINDVLDFSKLDAYGLDLHDEAVDLVALVTESVHLLRGQGAKAQVALRLDVGPAVPPIRADPRRLRQVILNLLSNGLKFTAAGGEVRVAVSWTPAGYAVTIRDTGIGIAPEDIDKALEPFGQIDSRLSRKYDGTGLGLPLAKRLIERHGGALSVESAVGVGTIVTVWLPAERAISQASVA